jgi:hypothetical protein
MNFEVFGLGKGWVQVRTFMSFLHLLGGGFWLGTS